MERTRGLGRLKSALFGHLRPYAPSNSFRSIAVASGKGGTGKSVLAASLASYFASQEKRVTLFDADLGVGNAHILQGVSPAYTAAHVISGLVELEDIALLAPTGVRVIPAGSGVAGLASLDRQGLQRIARGFSRVEESSDLLLIDSGAGISDQTIFFLLAADWILLVTTPDLTAMTDAYALIKVVHLRDPSIPIQLVVNRARNETEGRSVSEKIRGVAKRFLGKEIGCLGCIPEDVVVGESVSKKSPFWTMRPDAISSHALAELAEKIEALHQPVSHVGSFSTRILSRVG